eukprot:TRINITY_DN6236_c0_g1_i6.p4 TRINITY_DN6236_c0_g1~~TRINITY_DN6236_c0_g1_i6.p4  ORF type:complete len:141 (+),score=43.08 TRINITY_DN6236_c0_g1_i6:840-1262(+)
MKPDFVIFLGDASDHDVLNHTAERHLRSLQEFSRQLQDKYDGPVYPVMGNHEGLPCDIFDVALNGTHRWITEAAAEAWKPWLTDDMRETFFKLGCYSTLHKGTNLRIIALNPFVQLTDNFLIWGNQTDLLNTVSSIIIDS